MRLQPRPCTSFLEKPLHNPLKRKKDCISLHHVKLSSQHNAIYVNKYEYANSLTNRLNAILADQSLDAFA